MRNSTIFAAIAAAALCTAPAWGSEKIKLPSGPQTATPHVTAAVDHGSTPITNVGFGRRAARRGYYGGGWGPYYSYRPYYYGPSYGYYGGGYYSRPYYGYSYSSPGWYGYGPGPGMAFGTWGVPGRIWW